MKRIIILLILLASTQAHSAILVFSPNGSHITKPTLLAAATDQDAAGKTVVITSALSAEQSNISSATLHAWPSDRALKVERGGSIANTTNFTINSPFSAGTYRVFEGGGAVTFGTQTTVYPEWWGTEISDVQKAASALTAGGVLQLSGTYTLQKYNPSQPAGNFGVALLSNTWVRGVGKGKTILTCNGISNWFFNANGKYNIKITDLSIEKGNVLYMSGGGSNVSIDNISASGYTPDDLTHTLGSEAVRLYGITGLRISNSDFIDYNIGIELFENLGTKTTDVVISKCRFEQLAGHHGAYWDNPVGVYLVSTDNVKVTECTFLNIAPGGSARTRMGYGFYAGDGAGTYAVNNTVLASNVFKITDGALNTDYMQHVLFWANSNKWTSIGNLYTGRAPVVGGGTDVKSIGDTFEISWLLIYKADNAVVSGGTFRNTATSSIRFGQNTDEVKNALVAENTISSPVRAGVYFDVVGNGSVLNNIINEPVTTVSSSYAGIWYSSCYTGIVAGNTILQTSVGKSEYGIRLNPSHTGHVVYDNNVIEGMRIAKIANPFNATPTK